jgi:hypothetical protein
VVYLGRLVTEWAGKTAEDVHRQFADICPLYSRHGSDSEASILIEKDRESVCPLFRILAASRIRILTILSLLKTQKSKQIIN